MRPWVAPALAALAGAVVFYAIYRSFAYKIELFFSETCPACELYERDVVPRFPLWLRVSRVSVNDPRALAAAGVSRAAVPGTPSIGVARARGVAFFAGDVRDVPAIERFAREHGS